MSFKPGQRRTERRDPFSMLERSHHRLQEHLSTLLGAAAALNDDPRNKKARNQIVEVADFLGRSVARHERDEEESLFPRVRHRFRQIIATLEAEHRKQDKLHRELNALASACIRNELDAALVAHLSDLSMTLSKSYAHHIEIEELELFPKARVILTAATKATMAAEMQSRRGR
jgi:hemerythrin-like domain-containing protein